MLDDRPAPKRIQLRRTKGWRKPEGVVVVSRPTKWHNPYRVIRRNGVWGVLGRGDWSTGLEDSPWSQQDAQTWAVYRFREVICNGRNFYSDTVRMELAGRDLACWCPLEDADGNRMPCHADVLLEWANS